MSRLCPCTSKKTFDQCCQPFLLGKKLPDTPEQLMRSRFTAYSEKRADYLISTTLEEKRGELDLEELKGYCRTIKCISLKILDTAVNGDEGTVTFHASLQMGGRRTLHREHSTFRRVDGRWFYVDGETN